MASATVTELKKKSEAASANLHRQLEGMEPYLERSDAPGEWTTREVLCHGPTPADFCRPLVFPPAYKCRHQGRK